MAVVHQTPALPPGPALGSAASCMPDTFQREQVTPSFCVVRFDFILRGRLLCPRPRSR